MIGAGDPELEDDVSETKLRNNLKIVFKKQFNRLSLTYARLKGSKYNFPFLILKRFLLTWGN